MAKEIAKNYDKVQCELKKLKKLSKKELKIKESMNIT